MFRRNWYSVIFLSHLNTSSNLILLATTKDICIPKWGNGVRDIDNPIEECDDGNHFNYDGCSQSWTVEVGFVCSGGSATTIDKWIENKFMPIATLQVLTNNNLIIKFNDTITKINPTEEDLYTI